MRPLGRILWEFSDGTIRETPAYGRLNLLAHAEIFEIRVIQACGGQAECCTCRVEVIEGDTSPMIADEMELRRVHPKHFSERERLACRARPRSDIRVRVRSRRSPDLREGEH